MPKWPWIERKFNFDFPATKFPDILERLRGTPARVAERISGLDSDVLTRRDERGWSIQENIGHITDTEPLFAARVEELMSGVSVLTAADMTSPKTHEADHNSRPMEAVLMDLRSQRGNLVERLDALDEQDWSRSAMRPRLQQPMRLVDLIYFDSEHDDYHLARISELIRAFG